ncbi:MAG TPA: hypothetical protein VK168_19465 [Saprospiraceae bacterium]|nr:hypothetical protein [Saprospiraceae bacterium]
MENSTILALVRAIPTGEVREVRKFLMSPFFNQRQDVIALFDYLAIGGSPTREGAWKAVFGKGTGFELPKLRLVMSYLHKLLEQYLAVRETMSDPMYLEVQLVRAYRKRKMPVAFERERKAVQQSLELQSLRNAWFHDRSYWLHWETHQVEYPQNPTDVSWLLNAGQALDTAYLSRKLQLVCLLVAHRTVYKTTQEVAWEEDLINMAAQSGYAELPSVAVYLHCYHMLKEPTEETHFQHFKHILFEQGAQFSEEEIHGLFILAINYCVRRLNAGDTRFYREGFELYKEGLARNHILEDGILSRFTFHNIVALGLHVGELEWVRYFINEYKNKLERRYRESVFSFNLARLSYAERKHSHVLELLQTANYRDPLHNLAAKTLLLKTYFDLGEYDSLQSHLDAMRNYIQRKRVLGYHRTNYLNLIRYAEKILKLAPNDRSAAQILRQAIEKEEVLTEKTFLLKLIRH